MKFNVSTKKNKAASAVVTALEVIEDATPEVNKALARQSVVIRWQAWARKNGIPTTASIKTSDYAPGMRHAAPTLAESVAVLTPEQRAALIKQLQDMK